MISCYNLLPITLLSGLLVGCSASYDKCVIDEMRGQPESVISNVRQYCEELFPFEKRLYLDRKDIGFEFSLNVFPDFYKKNAFKGLYERPLFGYILKPSDAYVVTRVEFQLAERCKANDFGKTISVVITGFEGRRNSSLNSDTKFPLTGVASLSDVTTEFTCGKNFKFYGSLPIKFDVRKYSYF